MKSLRECASIAVTAVVMTRGRFFDDRDRRRHIAEQEQAEQLIRLRQAGWAVSQAERYVSEAWAGVCSAYPSEHDAFFDLAGYGG